MLSPATQLTTLQQQHPAANCAYSNAAVSEDGLHLLALCGPHQPYVELWALSPLQPLLTQDVLPPGTGMLSYEFASRSTPLILAKPDVAQQFLVYAGQCLSFHPSNSAIACSIARQQAEVLCFDKVLGQLVARKATVASATWRLEEQILCHCWTPNGMLVLGTSAGRILKAEGKFCDCTNHAACLACRQVMWYSAMQLGHWQSLHTDIHQWCTINIMMQSPPLLTSARHKAVKQPYITCILWEPLSILPILLELWGQGSGKTHTETHGA